MANPILRIGQMEIVPVNDGMTYIDAGGAFGLTPRALYKSYLTPDSENRIGMALNCLVLRTGGKTVLVDTGVGTKLTDKQRANWNLTQPDGGLVESLKANGSAPTDVDMVINTHLHGDHCGGNTYRDADGRIRATFPNAEYIAPRREYQDAMSPNERTRATYLTENYAPLVDSGQMRLLDVDQSMTAVMNNPIDILPGIRGHAAPGHTPGFMLLQFTSDGQNALYISDLAMYTAHFERLGWMSAFDVEPLITLESKRYWHSWCLEHDPLLFFQHDPVTFAGRLRRDGDRVRVLPELLSRDVGAPV